jgi:ribosomal protein L7/L12
MSQQEISYLTQRILILEGKVEALAAKLGVHFDVEGAHGGSVAPGAEPVPVGFGVPDDIAALARAGKTIDAIKAYRELTGVDLRTAKDVIESIH